MIRALLLCLLVSGCAGHLNDERPMTQPPSDWPQLQIIEGQGSILAACSKYTPWFAWPPMGCAEVNFAAGTCTIWAAAQWVYEEEVKHCVGRDHYQESALADAWTAYKQHAAGAAIARGLAK